MKEEIFEGDEKKAPIGAAVGADLFKAARREHLVNPRKCARESVSQTTTDERITMNVTYQKIRFSTIRISSAVPCLINLISVVCR